MALGVQAARIPTKRNKKQGYAAQVEQHERPNDVVDKELGDGEGALGDFFLHV
ncbi:hypothetical protein ACFPK6_06515 [Dokdonella soli]